MAVVVSGVDCKGGLIVPQAVIDITIAAKNAVITFVFIFILTPYQTIDQIYSGAVKVKIRQPKIMAIGVHSN